jgi:LPXTG-motif cell wall-anchored protein
MGLPMASVFDYSATVSCCASLGDRCHTNKQGENFVKRLVYLATASLVAMLIVVPSALAQQDVLPGDDDPHLPEPNAVVVGSHEELERIAGQPVPSQHPGEPPEQGGLPKTGGPSVSVILPTAALLLVGSGVLVYVVRRRGLEEDGGSVR